MADTLEDEWWMTGKNAEKADSENEQGSNQLEKKSKKRKQEFENDDAIEIKKKKKKSSEKSSKKKNGKIDDKNETDEKKNDDEAVKTSAEKKKKNKNKVKSVNNEADENSRVNINGKKKKKNKENKSNDDDLQKENEVASDKEKDSKKKKKTNRRRINDELNKKPDIPLVPYDLTALVTKFYTGNLSAVEMDELKLEEKHFSHCNDLTYTTPSYLKSLLPKWKKLLSDPSIIPEGSPLVIIVCSSGIRVMEVIRSLADFKLKDFSITKLFSKHLKIEEQMKFLKTHKTHLCVGTPNRIEALIQNGSLKLEQTKFIVLDWSWRDAKLSRLMDKIQLREHVMSLLKNCVIPRVKAEGSSLRIGLL